MLKKVKRTDSHTENHAHTLSPAHTRTDVGGDLCEDADNVSRLEIRQRDLNGTLGPK